MNGIKKPMLSEDEKEVIDAKIKMAEISLLTMDITYFNDGNTIKVKGKIEEADEHAKVIKLRNDDRYYKIKNILDIIIL